jgi:hypothetical protein
MGKSKKTEQPESRPATDPSGRNSDSGNPERPSQQEPAQEGEFRNAGTEAGNNEKTEDGFEPGQEDLMVETGISEKRK